MKKLNAGDFLSVKGHPEEIVMVTAVYPEKFEWIYTQTRHKFNQGAKGNTLNKYFDLNFASVLTAGYSREKNHASQNINEQEETMNWQCDCGCFNSPNVTYCSLCDEARDEVVPVKITPDLLRVGDELQVKGSSGEVVRITAIYENRFEWIYIHTKFRFCKDLSGVTTFNFFDPNFVFLKRNDAFAGKIDQLPDLKIGQVLYCKKAIESFTGKQKAYTKKGDRVEVLSIDHSTFIITARQYLGDSTLKITLEDYTSQLFSVSEINIPAPEETITEKMIRQSRCIVGINPITQEEIVIGDSMLKMAQVATEATNKKIVADYFASLGVPDGLIIGDDAQGANTNSPDVIFRGVFVGVDKEMFLLRNCEDLWFCHKISRPKIQPVQKSAREQATEMLEKTWKKLSPNHPLVDHSNYPTGFILDICTQIIEEALTLNKNQNT